MVTALRVKVGLRGMSWALAHFPNLFVEPGWTFKTWVRFQLH